MAATAHHVWRAKNDDIACFGSGVERGCVHRELGDPHTHLAEGRTVFGQAIVVREHGGAIACCCCSQPADGRRDLARARRYVVKDLPIALNVDHGPLGRAADLDVGARAGNRGGRVVIEGQQRFLGTLEQRLDLRHLIECEGLPADMEAMIGPKARLETVQRRDDPSGFLKTSKARLP